MYDIDIVTKPLKLRISLIITMFTSQAQAYEIMLFDITHNIACSNI